MRRACVGHTWRSCRKQRQRRGGQAASSSPPDDAQLRSSSQRSVQALDYEEDCHVFSIQLAPILHDLKIAKSSLTLTRTLSSWSTTASRGSSEHCKRILNPAKGFTCGERHTRRCRQHSANSCACSSTRQKGCRSMACRGGEGTQHFLALLFAIGVGFLLKF